MSLPLTDVKTCRQNCVSSEFMVGQPGAWAETILMNWAEQWHSGPFFY
jgi:hypothetical protein